MADPSADHQPDGLDRGALYGASMPLIGLSAHRQTPSGFSACRPTSVSDHSAYKLPNELSAIRYHVPALVIRHTRHRRQKASDAPVELRFQSLQRRPDSLVRGIDKCRAAAEVINGQTS
jgi:hypothetical protein